MTDVYVLTQGEYEDEGPVGVYTSLLLAQGQTPVTTRWEPMGSYRIVGPGQLEWIELPEEEVSHWSGVTPPDKPGRPDLSDCWAIFKFELDGVTDA